MLGGLGCQKWPTSRPMAIAEHLFWLSGIARLSDGRACFMMTRPDCGALLVRFTDFALRRAFSCARKLEFRHAG